MQDELNGQHWPRKGMHLAKHTQKIITYPGIFKANTLFSFSLQLADFKKRRERVKKNPSQSNVVWAT